MKRTQLKKLNIMLSLAISLFMMTRLSFAETINSRQELLNSIAGHWRSELGYVLNYPGSSCFTTQSFAVFLTNPESANFSYSFACSTGYQAQMQGLDFNPERGTYQNGYNTITSRFLLNNDGRVFGIERHMMTTWGFGNMINYQYQTARIKILSQNDSGNAQTLSLEIINSQSNVQNGQATTYYLNLIRF
jgi:hypothetical protein